MAAMMLGWSCREVYLPDDINSPEKIPVIEGIIEEGDVPRVKLTWALGYGDKETEYISEAEITISDDLGNSVGLDEVDYGIYTSVFAEIRGAVGRTYTLHVLLPDGSEFISSPELLRKSPAIDSLYADPGIRNTYTYNTENEPMPVYQEGLFILADLSEISDSVLYYRFNTKITKEITYTKDPGSTAAQTVYVWESTFLDNVYSVNYTVAQGNRQLLPAHDVGFVQFLYEPYKESPEATAPWIVGWVISFNVYSISADVYNYHNSIARQLGSKDQLFAPVPSQVKSTFNCLTDPDKAVIGVFEATSRATVYKAFSWDGPETYRSLDLQSFPGDLEDGSTMPFPPDFWIPFY